MENVVSLLGNKKAKEVVRDLLITRPKTRDDDLYLVATAWLKEIGGRKAASEMTALDFLINLANEQYLHFESLRRYRQLLQDAEPELRGAKYQKRITKLEALERDNVRNFTS